MPRRTAAPLLLLIVLLAALARAQAPAGEAPKRVEKTSGTDRFAAGDSVRIDQAVAGDLIAAGGEVSIAAPVNADAVVFGGNVRVSSAVGGTLYAAGGQVTLASSIGRNARVAGGRVELAPGGNVAGNLSIAGGQVNIEGAVKGYVQAAGGRVFINGPIAGDVEAASGDLELGPAARIAGTLRYASREQVHIDPAAQVTGGIERMQVDTGWQRKEASTGAGWIWTVGLMVLAGVLVAAAPALTARATTTLRTRVGWSLLVGFIALVCVPVAIIVLLVTLIGIPLALLGLVLYFALLLAGYVMTGIGVGDFALSRLRPAAVENKAWRIGAAVLGLFLIALLARLPWVGGLVTFVVLLAGFGALLMQVRAARAA